jgi:hypothetical protein
MRAGSEGLHVIHGRQENDAIHDETGLRHYYAEWARRMKRDPRDPLSTQERESRDTARPRGLSILQSTGAE